MQGTTKDLILGLLRSSVFRSKAIEVYIKGRYAYIHIGYHVYRGKETLTRYWNISNGTPINHSDKLFNRYYQKFPYHVALLISYLQDKLINVGIMIPTMGRALPDSISNSQEPESTKTNETSMILKENIIGALAKKPNNLVVTGITKKSQINFVGIPVLDDKGDLKIFIKDKNTSPSIKKSKKTKVNKAKWSVYTYEDLIINDLDNLAKSRVTESPSCRLINASNNCFNLEFKVISLTNEVMTNDVLKEIKTHIVEDSSPHKLKGILIQRNEKEGQAFFITEYAGVPVHFLTSNCELYKPSLKGFNIPKNRNKVEGSLAKIIRNKKTIFNMDEKVKILKFEKNLKTPQRHYFTVQSLENSSKISTVYSHNIKVI